MSSPSSESSPHKTKSKRGRTRGVSLKFQQGSLNEEKFTASMKDKRINVKCNQSGKVFKSKVNNLSRDDGEPLQKSDFFRGSQLLMDFDKKTWPVTVQKVVSISDELQIEDQPQKKVKRSAEGDEPLSSVIHTAKQSFDQVDESGQESDSSVEVQPTTSQAATATSDDLLKILLEIRAAVNTLVDASKKGPLEISDVKKEDDTNYTVSGVNLLGIPARDANAYGRSLLDVLFSKQEQAKSVIVETKKSMKPPLSPPRIKKLFDCVKRRYKDYDYKRLMVTLGQKCRDASRDAKNNTKEE